MSDRGHRLRPTRRQGDRRRTDRRCGTLFHFEEIHRTPGRTARIGGAAAGAPNRPQIPLLVHALQPGPLRQQRHRSGRSATGPRRAQRNRYGLSGLSVNNQSRPPGISTRSHSARNSAAPLTTACCTTMACRLSAGSGNGSAQRASPPKRLPLRYSRKPRPCRASRGGRSVVGVTHSQGCDGRVCIAASANWRSSWSRLRPPPVSNQDETPA